MIPPKLACPAPCLVALLALAACNAEPTRLVHGGVVFIDSNGDGIRNSGEPGLGDAIVFFETGSPVRTNAAGEYKISLAASDGILWVRGQDGLNPGPFWNVVSPDSDRTDIPVRVATGTGDFSFVVASDTHAGIAAMSSADQIAGMVQAAGVDPKPYFVTVTGDITQGNEPEHFDAVFDSIDAIDIPYVPVPGNHDWYDGGATYRARLGPPTYSFDAGGVHFAVLNDAASLENRLAFLDLDRTYVRDDRPVVVLMHAPPREDLRLALEERDISLLLTGHMHTNRVLLHDTFVEYNTQPLVMGGMDLSPAGFRIFRFAADKSFEVDHHTTVNQSVLAIVSPAVAQVFAPCTAKVIVAAEPGVAIKSMVAVVDGVGEVVLQPQGGWNYASATLTTLCQPGRYLVDVEMESADGVMRAVDAEIVVGTALPTPTVGEWKMFQGDAQHTGARSERVDYPLRTEWVATVGSNIHGGAPVVAEGRVFVSVTDFGSGLKGGVVALDLLSGRTLWEHRVGFSVRNAAAVVGTVVVFVSNDGTVHGVDVETGEGLWTYELAPQVPTVQRNIYSSPTAVGEVVYVGGRHEFAALIAASGEVVWNVEPMDNFGDLSSHASAAVIDDMVIIPFNRRDGLFAFDRETGNELWKTGPEVVQAVHGSPVIVGDEVFVINELTRLTSLSVADSQQNWGLTLESGAFGWGFLAESTPVVQGTTLVVGTQRGGLHAIDTANRGVRWTFEADLSLIRATHYRGESAAITAAPVITGDLIWVPGQDGQLRALDLVTGEVLWSANLGVPMSSSPAIAGDLLVVASYDGSVRAMRSAPSALATMR